MTEKTQFREFFLQKNLIFWQKCGIFFEKEYTGLDEATAYTINFDAPTVGGSTITISFNNNIEEVDLGEFELNE